MNAQNNVDSQNLGKKTVSKPDKANANPGASKDFEQSPGQRKINQTNDDLANSAENSDEINKARAEGPSETGEDPRRYDEADPRWTNEDVQMDNTDINPELQANLGPQS